MDKRMIPKTKENFVVDEAGACVGVFLPMGAYQKLMDDLEELECIRAYDAAKTAEDEVIPIEQAIDEIDRDRP